MSKQYIKIDENGTKFYFKDKAMTKLHREDGAALEYAYGYKAWFLEGNHYNEAEFKAKMQPVKELTVADIEKLLGHRVKIVKQ